MLKAILGRSFSSATMWANAVLVLLVGLQQFLPVVQDAIAHVAPDKAIVLTAAVAMVARLRGIVASVVDTLGGGQ